jgi:superfamily II DNA or RNA helicase
MSKSFKVYSFLDKIQQDAFNAVVSSTDQRDSMHVINSPTGSGKTRIAIALADHFLESGYTIVWLSKSWTLLKQAVEEFRTLVPGQQELMRRIGGSNESLASVSENGKGRLYFSTLQTWCSRKRRKTLPNTINRRSKLLVLWDECHWALTSQFGAMLLRYYLRETLGATAQNPFVVGMSATPKVPPNGKIHLASTTSYKDLIGCRVAHPILRTIKTGVTWDPIIRNDVIARESLQALGIDLDRNHAIVNEILEGRSKGKYRKILIFACNIQHANLLHQRFSERGVPSRVVHSGLPAARREDAIRQFQVGEVEVLVNVNQLAEGTNIPEIDTIVIARPAAKPGHLMQMIGRGCRLAPGKSHFHVVEFDDHILNHADQLYHASDVLPVSSHPPSARTDAVRKLPNRHQEPDQVVFDNISLPGIGLLPFARDQTFGFEIELTSPRGVPPDGPAWHTTALEIIKVLQAKLGERVCPSPLPYHSRPDDLHWAVERDGSAGWEIVSPILVNASGLGELQQVCDTLERLLLVNHELTVNWRTGLHLTLATRLDSKERISGFLKRVQRLEPGLFSLVAPSRLYRYKRGKYNLTRRNQYCKPWRGVNLERGSLDLQLIVRDEDRRYHSISIQHAYDDIQKLEIRMHHGTVEFRKMALWLSLWMQIFNHSRYSWTGSGATERVFDNGNVAITPEEVANEDLLGLLRQEGIFLHLELERQLRERRRELRPYWSRVLPNRVSCWEREGWYDRE